MIWYARFDNKIFRHILYINSKYFDLYQGFFIAFVASFLWFAMG